MRVKWKLTIASFKMYFRQREAIIWSFILPLFIVVLFGFVRFGGMGTIELGIVDDSGGNAEQFLSRVRNVKAFSVTSGSRETEMGALAKGDLDIVLVIPSTYKDGDGSGGLLGYTNDEKVQQTQIGTLLLQRILDEQYFDRQPGAGRTTLQTQAVKSRNLTYIDFLLPGILAMSIMQMGFFGVAFGFVSLKKRGILRRLSVTPIRPSDFIAAQVAMRVVVLMMQIILMVGVGILFLHLHFAGNLFSMFLVGTLGAIVFLSMGFALAGVSKSEDQVAPLANVITLPMLLLSGIFFGRSSFPGFVKQITDYFPLTYLADGLRAIAVDGASLMTVGPQIAGLLVWSLISTFIAIRLFHWE